VAARSRVGLAARRVRRATGRSHRPVPKPVPAFDEELARRHPAGLPHHHLAILAVRPDQQGQGIGTRLLDAHHAILDAKGIVAYLEASDERNLACTSVTATPITGSPFSCRAAR
jgi:GNAT superfamily N-acetyltransferase